VKKTIVWDRDDVLNDLMRLWLDRWWKPRHKECNVGYADLRENPPHRILGISLKEYKNSLDQYRMSTEASKMEPLPEVAAWFRQFGHGFRHMVLSATSLATAPMSAAWTFHHFGTWVRSFHLIPSIRHGQTIPQYEENKGEYLHWLGKGDVLVDDSPTNLDSAKDHGISGVLIPRPWNGNVGNISEALNALNAILEKPN